MLLKERLLEGKGQEGELFKMIENINKLESRLKDIESMFNEMGPDLRALVQTETKNKWNNPLQSEALFGLFTGTVTDTLDPQAKNRVRVFCPYLHSLELDSNALPWVRPISTLGGFDDSGCSWVPPAGSKLVFGFENGDVNNPFYFGTTWDNNRGPQGNRNYGVPMQEFNAIHEAHRGGYIFGKNDGSQVYPPSNTESYNTFDRASLDQTENDPNYQDNVTYPNIHVLKTPQKHTVKMVDGDYKCGNRGKRFEMHSSTGNFMIMKDDHLHNAQTFVHPSCGADGEQVRCQDENGLPIELDCEGDESNSSIRDGHPSTPRGTKYGLDSNKGSNQYYKHQNECRPYRGPGTPQNNKVTLPQAGIQWLSTSGQTLIFDDSVEEPRGAVNWERSTQPFDFGCNDKFLGKIEAISATGHYFGLYDTEEESNLRGVDNGIKMKTANGSYLNISDHTEGQASNDGECKECPPNLAGRKRGISMGSTSMHTFEMIDWGNEQCAPCRKEGGIPINKADKAYVRLRSGYGLELMMKDQSSQEETQEQYIQLLAPQNDACCGPHVIRMQENPNGGQVYIQAGGTYLCFTAREHVTIVGDKEGCLGPQNKIALITNNNVLVTDKFHYHRAEHHMLHAEKYGFFIAGGDCKPKPPAEECQPCIWPVLCLSPKGITVSDRIFVSASADASCASLFQLREFTKCPPFQGCS